MTDEAKGSGPTALDDDELNEVAGGQKVYKTDHPGSVNQQTGLRPFELPIDSDRQQDT